MARNRRNNHKPNNKPQGSQTQSSNRADDVTESTSSFAKFFGTRTQEVNDTCTMGFNRPLGDSMQVITGSNIYAEDVANPTYENIVEPGLMVLNVRYGPGFSRTGMSAVNTKALEIFTKLKTRGNNWRLYDPADLMIHLMCMDTVYIWYQNLLRVHAIIKRGFTAYNKYKPRAIVRALGFDYDDIAGTNLPRFRSLVNWFVDKMNTFYIPDMTYFAWHRELFTALYSDSEDPRAQMYAFKPDGFYTFDWENAQLVYHAWGYRPMTGQTSNLYGLEAIEEICNYFMAAIATNQDCGMLNADIRAAFESSELFTFEYLDPEKEVDIWYDKAMLNAIANADITPLSTSGQNITQDKSIGAGGIIYTPKPTGVIADYTNGSNKYLMSSMKMINMHDHLTSPEMVAMSTRFMTGVINGREFVFGTEIITRADIITFNPDNMEGQTSMNYTTSWFYQWYTGQEDFVTIMDKVSAFDYAPKTIYAPVNSDGFISDAKKVSLITETNCYDLFATTQLKYIHTTMILSLWEVADNM